MVMLDGCYKIIFQNTYEFMTVAKTLEPVLNRLDEFIFLLTWRDSIKPILLIEEHAKELFNNVMHITLSEDDRVEIVKGLADMQIYARLYFKDHYAIPFTLIPEPFPLYRILADYYEETLDKLAFIIHAKQKSEKVSIASFLKKHEARRSSLFYAYNEHIRAKLSSTHFHATLILASSNKKILLKALRAFRLSHLFYTLKRYDEHKLLRILFKRPKKPLLLNKRYTVLSSTELISLMLPDSLRGVKIPVDGIRAYTTGGLL